MRLGPWLVVSVVALAGGDAAAKKVDPVAAALQRLGAAADCGDPASLWRTWCIAVAWDEGQAAPLPGGPLIGLTIRIEDGKKVSTALVDDVTFAALAITKSADATKVKLNDITPSNPDESQAVAFAVFGVSSVLKGKSERAELRESPDRRSGRIFRRG